MDIQFIMSINARQFAKSIEWIFIDTVSIQRTYPEISWIIMKDTGQKWSRVKTWRDFPLYLFVVTRQTSPSRILSIPSHDWRWMHHQYSRVAIVGNLLANIIPCGWWHDPQVLAGHMYPIFDHDTNGKSMAIHYEDTPYFGCVWTKSSSSCLKPSSHHMFKYVKIPSIHCISWPNYAGEKQK